MKICLYSPYFPDHFGGGEKYLLDVAQVLSTKHQVFLAITSKGEDIDETGIKQSYQKLFNIDLSQISLMRTPLGTPKAWWQKLMWTAQFDVLYYITDGSLFFSLARKNILHIQIPFTAPKNTFSDRLKLANWQIKNTNSEFTKAVISKTWRTKIDEVHWPMIEAPQDVTFEELKKQKQKIILNVGRFFRQLHTKRQDVLVHIFKSLLAAHPKEMKGWKLILVGAIEDQGYVDEIKALAKGLPIELHHEYNYQQLMSCYQQAAIYWHAAGYEIDEQKHPEKVEHFGITTVEAMARAAAPVVIGKGGQKEIVGAQLQKWLWQTSDECLKLSYALISQPKILGHLQEVAMKRSSAFNREAFSQTLWRMIEK